MVGNICFLIDFILIFIFYFYYILLGTTLVIYIVDRRFNPFFFMKKLLRLEIPTTTPSEEKLITFIEELISIRSLIMKSIDQIELVERMLNGSNFNDNNNNDYVSDNQSAIKPLITKGTPKTKKTKNLQ